MEFPNSTGTIVLDFKTHQAELKMSTQELKFSRILHHIEAVNRAGNEARVLVHCAMGKSRSATAFMMYMMRRYNLSLDDAFEFCKSQRQQTEPNEGFMEQLRTFEANDRRFDSEL